jgi:hypothetical protein
MLGTAGGSQKRTRPIIPGTEAGENQFALRFMGRRKGFRILVEKILRKFYERVTLTWNHADLIVDQQPSQLRASSAVRSNSSKGRSRIVPIAWTFPSLSWRRKGNINSSYVGMAMQSPVQSKCNRRIG